MSVVEKRDVHRPMLFECAWEVANKGEKAKVNTVDIGSATSTISASDAQWEAFTPSSRPRLQSHTRR